MAESKLTVIVPTLDEERNISSCLASVAWADEILVVDSGSHDRTQELARTLGARVLVRPFTTWGDQRNFGAGSARNDWILCVDADERVTPDLRAEIEALLARGCGHAGYRIPRRSTFGGQPVRHCGWGRDRVLRLYDRRLGAWDQRLVHEKVVLQAAAAAAGELGGILLHHTARDLFHQADKERRYAALGAEELHRCGRRAGALDMLLRPVLRFVKMYAVDLGFLDGTTGVLVSGLAAWGVFLKYARLWELGRPKP